MIPDQLWRHWIQIEISRESIFPCFVHSKRWGPSRTCFVCARGTWGRTGLRWQARSTRPPGQWCRGSSVYLARLLSSACGHRDI